MRNSCLLLGVLAALSAACSRSGPGTLVKGGYDQREMDEAVAQARKAVDWFLDEMNGKRGEEFSVKVGVTEGTQVEHFWLTDVTFDGTEFRGLIGNEPGILKGVRQGQKWNVKKAEITDWMFRRDGKIHGNYTLRPLLKTLPPEEAARYRAMLAGP